MDDDSGAATKWAWRIAFSPLVYLVGTYVAGISDTGAYILVGLIVIAATFACSADVKELNQRGVEAEQSFTAAVLLFYIIGAPAHLIYRTRKASSTPLIPVAWFASVGAVIAGSVLASGGLGLQMDVPVLEADLAGEVRELGARGVSVDCPDDEAYADGDMVICDVTTSSDGPLQIVLDMRNDLGYEWQVQQP